MDAPSPRALSCVSTCRSKTWYGTKARSRASAPAAGVETARIVIGADGSHSLIAKLVDAPSYDEAPPQLRLLQLLDRHRDRGQGAPAARGDRFLGLAPTNDGKTFMFYQAPIAQFHEHRTDIEGHYLEAMGATRGWPSSLRTPHASSASRHGRPAELLPQAVRAGLGPGRRRRLPQGPDHRRRASRTPSVAPSG